MTIFEKIAHIDDLTNVDGDTVTENSRGAEPGTREGRVCEQATKDCPGDYNRGICEALGKPGSVSPIAADHQGLHDELYHHAPGDFFLASRDAIHALGGYHQVPSTYHIDTLLLCKARGAGMRQVVLVWPCLLLHERHPVSDRKPFILPGWDLTPELCERVSEEARRLFHDSKGLAMAVNGTCGWDGRSMNSDWGYPEEKFEEGVLRMEHEPDYFDSVAEFLVW